MTLTKPKTKQLSQPEPYKLLISGGGTGGHVFPAIAIANAFVKRFSDAKVQFVGAKGRLEMTKVPEAGYNIEGLWISGIQRKEKLKNLSLPFKIISSMLKARRIVKRFKPDVAVGVGGYASGPTLYMAHRMGIPTLIQEQNSFAGVTNKMMAKKAQAFCVAYDGMEKFFPKERIVKTGNPVRDLITDMQSNRTASLGFFGLDESAPVVLAIGGSLGARTINESLQNNLAAFKEKQVQLLWQTGRMGLEASQKAAEGYPDVRVHEFIREMDKAYDAADVIISRAGAISISELCVIGKPVILVPSPNVAEDHQTKNALALEEKHAAIMIRDNEAREKLVPAALDLLENNDKKDALSTNIKMEGIPDAADRIVDEIEKLIKK